MHPRVSFLNVCTTGENTVHSSRIPEERSISALVKPASDGYVPRNEKVALYEGPDVHIPDFDIPEGQVDVVAILENRRRRLDQNTAEHDENDVEHAVRNQSPTARRLDDAIVPGKDGRCLTNRKERVMEHTRPSAAGLRITPVYLLATMMRGVL